MLKPVIISLIVPVIIGILFGLSGVSGMIIGSVITSTQLSLSFITSGGSWENAKGYLEQYD